MTPFYYVGNLFYQAFVITLDSLLLLCFCFLLYEYHFDYSANSRYFSEPMQTQENRLQQSNEFPLAKVSFSYCT